MQRKDGKSTSALHPFAKVMRSRLWFGTPLEGFSHKGDKPAAQKERYQQFLYSTLYPALRDASANMKHVRVLYYGYVLTQHEVHMAVAADSLFAIGSAIFVFSYMWFHTGSPSRYFSSQNGRFL